MNKEIKEREYQKKKDFSSDSDFKSDSDELWEFTRSSTNEL